MPIYGNRHLKTHPSLEPQYPDPLCHARWGASLRFRIFTQLHGKCQGLGDTPWDGCTWRKQQVVIFHRMSFVFAAGYWRWAERAKSLGIGWAQQQLSRGCALGQKVMCIELCRYYILRCNPGAPQARWMLYDIYIYIYIHVWVYMYMYMYMYMCNMHIYIYKSVVAHFAGSQLRGQEYGSSHWSWLFSGLFLGTQGPLSSKANSTVGLVGLLGVLVDLLNNLNTSASEHHQWREVTAEWTADGFFFF